MRTPSSDPMVLHVRVATGSGGGPEKTIVNSPRFLKTRGFDSACAYIHPSTDSIPLIRRRAAEANARFISIPDHSPVDWSTLKSLVRICQDENVAIWHGHDYKSNLFGLFARRWHAMKLFTTVHGWVRFTTRTPFYYAIDRACLPYYDEVICVSQDLYDRCIKLGTDVARCHLIGNAIDVDMFVPRPRAEVIEAPVTIGGMGRLSQEKGFDFLIMAVKRLLEDGQAVRLRIAGDGELSDSLRSQVNRLGIQDHVELVGHVSDPREFYESLDVFVLSSLREGLPNVLLEAMAMAIPIVATKIAGIPHLIDDRVNGLLVEPRSVDALYGAIHQLVADRDLADGLGKAGRSTVVDGYSFANRMDRIAELYRDQLARSER